MLQHSGLIPIALSVVCLLRIVARRLWDFLSLNIYQISSNV